MKQCRSCKEFKSAEEFWSRTQSKDGLNLYCIPCAKAKHRETAADRAERLNEYNRKYRAEHPEMVERAYLIDRCRKYGINIEYYEKLLKRCKGVCEICGDGSRQLQIDHCHRTGKVRGLICSRCNKGLSLFRDAPRSLKRAAAYLVRSAG